MTSTYGSLWSDWQMYIDDLPIWGMVGEVDDSTEPPSYKLFTHKKLDIGYNDHQIVDVNLTSDGRVKLAPGAKLDFSYEVNFRASPIAFHDRFDKYLDPNFFQHRVRSLPSFAFFPARVSSSSLPS